MDEKRESHLYPVLPGSSPWEGFVIRRILLVLWVFGVSLCISLPLRARQSKPNSPLTDTQKDGRRIFQQRCAVCHTPPTVVARRYGPALYKEIVEDNEDTIRDTIMEGREALMPGFKYGLTRPEIDSIIEYLKTLKRPISRPKNRNPDSPEGNSSPGESN